MHHRVTVHLADTDSQEGNLVEYNTSELISIVITISSGTLHGVSRKKHSLVFSAMSTTKMIRFAQTFQ